MTAVQGPVPTRTHGAGGRDVPKARVTPDLAQRVVGSRCGLGPGRGERRRGREAERVEIRGERRIICHSRSATNGRHFSYRTGWRWETRRRREWERGGRRDQARFLLREQRHNLQGGSPLGACVRIAANGRPFGVSTSRYERVCSVYAGFRSADPARAIHFARSNACLAANGRPCGMSTPRCGRGLSLLPESRSAGAARIVHFPRGNGHLAANGRLFRAGETRSAVGAHFDHDSRYLAEGCCRMPGTSGDIVAARDTRGRICARAGVVSRVPFSRCLVRGHRSRSAANGRPSRDERIDRQIRVCSIGDRWSLDRPYRREPGAVRDQERESRRVRGGARVRRPKGFQ